MCDRSLVCQAASKWLMDYALVVLRRLTLDVRSGDVTWEEGLRSMGAWRGDDLDVLWSEFLGFVGEHADAVHRTVRELGRLRGDTTRAARPDASRALLVSFVRHMCRSVHVRDMDRFNGFSVRDYQDLSRSVLAAALMDQDPPRDRDPHVVPLDSISCGPRSPVSPEATAVERPGTPRNDRGPRIVDIAPTAVESMMDLVSVCTVEGPSAEDGSWGPLS